MRKLFRVQVQAQFDVIADSEEEARDEAVSRAMAMESDLWGTIMIGRTYSIIRSSRKSQKTVRTVIESGLSWEEADSKRDKLAEIDREANPLKSCWTRDVFLVEMEIA